MVTPPMMSILGANADDMEEILKGLGYRAEPKPAADVKTRLEALDQAAREAAAKAEAEKAEAAAKAAAEQQQRFPSKPQLRWNRPRLCRRPTRRKPLRTSLSRRLRQRRKMKSHRSKPPPGRRMLRMRQPLRQPPPSMRSRRQWPKRCSTRPPIWASPIVGQTNKDDAETGEAASPGPTPPEEAAPAADAVAVDPAAVGDAEPQSRRKTRSPSCCGVPPVSSSAASAGTITARVTAAAPPRQLPSRASARHSSARMVGRRSGVAAKAAREPDSAGRQAEIRSQPASRARRSRKAKADARITRKVTSARASGEDGRSEDRGPKPAFQPRPREERPAQVDPHSPFAKLAALRDQLARSS